MRKHDEEPDCFMEELHNLDALFRHHNIAVLIECKRPNFDSRDSSGEYQYAEATFQPLNLALFEEIIRFINKRALKSGTKVGARIIEQDVPIGESEEKRLEYTVLAIPYKEHAGEPKSVWVQESYRLFRQMKKAVEDFQQKYKRSA